MIGDKLTYHESFSKVTKEVISKIKSQFQAQNPLCIAIAGESGSGKTSLAYTLLIDIEKQLGCKGYLFHADDYFYFPPKENHNKRLEDISNVGVSEVNLKLLDTNLLAFKTSNAMVEKPLVNYTKNTISKEVIAPQKFNFCIVEGTYTMLLLQPDFKIFIDNTYIDTFENRLERARDILNSFNEDVLKIEHQIIKQHAKHADMIIKNNRTN